MFIAATAFAVSRRLDVPLVLDTSFLAAKRQHQGDLDRLHLGSRAPRKTRRWLTAEPHQIRRLGSPACRRLGLFVEAGFPYDPAVRAVEPGTTLVGYFQSWRYFDEVADELRHRFTTIGEPTDWFLETKAALQQLDQWVAVHVRQGDYLDPVVAEKHGNVTGGFFDRALETMDRLGRGGRVVLFSDRPETAQSLTRRFSDALVIEPPRHSHPIESINLMAMAQGLVASNSSFSWWAGYLGERPDRPVICPRPWFGRLEHDTRDLLLPDWLTVERRQFEN
jgi:hypothetical protein